MIVVHLPSMHRVLGSIAINPPNQYGFKKDKAHVNCYNKDVSFSDISDTFSYRS